MRNNPKIIFFSILSFSILFFSCSEKQEKQKKTFNGVWKSMGEWYDSRAYPYKTIDTQIWKTAFENMLHRDGNKQSSSVTSWEALGPMNFGGRTLCITFNPIRPQSMYAGSASGGLWRSYSGALGVQAWHPIPTGFPVLGVASIAISPTDTNTIYIGTGEVYNYQNTGTGFSVRTTRGTYGIGILKSIDNGITWTKSLDWQLDELKGVQDLLINPLNSNTVWACTTEGTYVSYDAGNNWILKHPVQMATDIVMPPGDTSVVLIAAGNLGSPGTGIYRSTNGGFSFSQITNGLPGSYDGKVVFSFSESSPNIVYASIANSFAGVGLYISTNQGLSWSLKSTEDYPKYQGWYSHGITVDPSNSNNVIAFGIDVWKSTSQGTGLIQKSYWSNWNFSATPVGGPEGPSDYVHADIHQAIYMPGSPQTVYFATDGGIFRSTDNGETFSGHNGMYHTQQFYANISNSSTDSLFIIGGMQDNATAVYEGNPAWRRVIGGDGLSTAVDPLNDNRVYASSQYLNVYRSMNKAMSFGYLSGLPSGSSANTTFAGAFEHCSSSPNKMYAARTEVYRSSNYGDSFQTGPVLNGNTIIALGVSPLNCNYVFASVTPVPNPPNSIYKSIDGGISWNLSGSGLPDRYYMDFAFDPLNDQNVYVVLSGFGTEHLYKSTDAGISWNAVPGLPDVPANCIVIDPLYPSNIYVGTDLGIFVSADAGASWISWNDGLWDATMVMHMTISNSNRKLRIGTHGKGIWQRELLLPGTTSINQLTKIEGSVYPIPAIDVCTIELKNIQGQALEIKIYDLNGKQVFPKFSISRDHNTAEIRIQKTNLNSGLYLVNVNDSQNQKTMRILFR